MIITLFADLFILKTFIDKAYAVVPEFENRISRFDKKLRMALYAERTN